jgi:glycosyltransferase involved in cell wall biosynthesis
VAFSTNYVKNTMMKILFVNPHMQMGGIANSLYNLLRELQKEKDLEIDLLCFNPYFNAKFRDIEGTIKVHSSFILKCLFISFKEARVNLSLIEIIPLFFLKLASKVIGLNRLRLFVVRNFCCSSLQKNYALAIAFSNDIPANNVLNCCNDFILTCVSANQKAAWIHNDLDRLGITRKYILKTYANFDEIVNVSRSCKAVFDKLAPEFIRKSYLVHNYIDPAIILEKANAFNPYQRDKDTLIFVTIARIENTQKRIDRILQTIEELKDHPTQFRWYIIGDGPDRAKLEIRSGISGLESIVSFEGFQQNPYPYLKNADCFVLSSAYEAQGMVLSEAIIIGTPVVTTNFPAAQEFVSNLENGFIVDNSTEALSQRIESILDNPDCLLALKNNISVNRQKGSGINVKKEFYSLFKEKT